MKKSPRELGVVQWIVERRGTVFHNGSLCVYCGLCAKNCPMKAIAINQKGKVLRVDPYLCVRCGKCAKACPKGALHLENSPGNEVHS